MLSSHRIGPGRLILFLRALGLWLLMAASAHAHAALNRAEPADGAKLSAAPSVFRLTFNEAVAPTRLRLTGPDGKIVTLDRSRLEGTTLVVAAPPDLGDGGYVLSWRVVSEDGHPIGGSVVFAIGDAAAPGAGSSATAAQDDPIVQTGLWIGKLCLYLGLFFGIGGVFACAWFASPPSAGRRLVVGALALGGAGVVVSAGFQGLDAAGAAVREIADGAIWRAGLATSFGTSLVFSAAALACAAVALGQGSASAGARWISLGALLSAGLALSLSGHAAAADPQWLMRPAVFLHVVAVAVWAGALPVLAVSLRAGGESGVAGLLRFSAAIPLLLLLLVAAGAVLAVVQVRTAEALVTTAYGRVFLVKLALLLPLFLLAARNRWRLTVPVARGEGASRRAMARAIVVETVIVALVLATAALWRFTPPPRSMIEAGGKTATVQMENGTLAAELLFSRADGRAIVALRRAGGPVDPLEVSLVLANPAAGIEPIRRPAARQADGTWRVAEIRLPVPGAWSVRLDVVISDFEIVRLTGELAGE